MDRYFKVSKRTPIERDTLAGKTTAALRNMIISGEFPPAAKITENSLAEAIGVSRSCIRESVITLEQEGLLTKVQNHYTQVVQFTTADVDEICELRLAIESLALKKCIESRSLDLEKMDKHVHNLVDSINLDSEDNVIGWLKGDMDFHREIVSSAGNQRMLAFWESLSNQVVAMLYMAQRMNPGLIASPTNTHAQILTAIRQNDYPQAKRLLQEHIMASVSWVRQAVSFREEPAGSDG
jgi:DNA-binding GntR family transcriptional regulator